MEAKRQSVDTQKSHERLQQEVMREYRLINEDLKRGKSPREGILKNNNNNSPAQRKTKLDQLPNIGGAARFEFTDQKISSPPPIKRSMLENQEYLEAYKRLQSQFKNEQRHEIKR